MVAKLRREVRNRILETAREFGEEENEIVKDLIAGRETKPKNAEKQRLADMEESEVIGENEMKEESTGRKEAEGKKKKTDWAAKLEVAREKDTMTTEKNGPGKEWRMREGKGKTRSGVSEKRGKGPSPGLRMVPNMGRWLTPPDHAASARGNGR